MIVPEEAESTFSNSAKRFNAKTETIGSALKLYYHTDYGDT